MSTEASPPRARVFLALALGEDLGARVAAAAQAALGGPEAARDFRLARGAGLHLTLHFLGGTERARLAELESCLGASLAGRAAPRLCLAGAGAFPDSRKPRVLWLGVQERAGAGALAACQRAVLDAVRRAGLGAPLARQPAPEPFHPHVTVARPRSARVRVPASFAALRMDLDWDPAAVVCMESQPGPGGSRYEVLASFVLEDAQ